MPIISLILFGVLGLVLDYVYVLDGNAFWLQIAFFMSSVLMAVSVIIFDIHVISMITGGNYAGNTN